MATDAEGEFQELMKDAGEYHGRALWEDKLRTLQDALSICQRPGFPDGSRRTQQVLIEMGGIRRRFGQYDKGIETLSDALKAFPDASPTIRAEILGEQAVIYRHKADFDQARSASEEQYRLVQDSGDKSLEADAQLCRARGNSGMSAFNMAKRIGPPDIDMLQLAHDHLQERIERARGLQMRLALEPMSNEGRTSDNLVQQARAWETIGMDHLVHVLVAQGKTAKAVQVGWESQQKQSGRDPTSTAWSRFDYGYALWYNGQRLEALQQWSAPEGTCSSAAALCKEPAAEHVKHLKLIAEAGVDFDTYDEQGFSALDYATFSNTEDGRQLIQVITNALRKTFASQMLKLSPGLSQHELNAKVEDKIALRLSQAKLRSAYRYVLQEHFRPVLNSDETDAIGRLRVIYSNVLHEDPSLRDIFDDFHFIMYNDLRRLGRIPESTQNLAIQFFCKGANGQPQFSDDQFVIFFSYRWLGCAGDPPQPGSDDTNRTQWHRMMNAIDKYVKQVKNVNLDNLGIWLDSACISQHVTDQRDRGISALPLAVTQCNALISLVDESYYMRAWCTIEAILFRELAESYHLHAWWEHVLTDPHVDRVEGTLKRGKLSKRPDVSKLQLTKEEVDRPKIDFLLRQSRLLGKDTA